MKLKIFTIYIMACLIMPLSVFAEDSIYSQKNQLGFINYLFNNNEYQRTIYEIDRYNYKFNDKSNQINVTENICKYYLNIKLNIENDININVVSPSSILLLDYYNKNFIKYDKFLNVQISNSQIDEFYYKRLVLNDFINNDFKEAKIKIDEYKLDSFDYDSFQKEYDRFKSPAIAMALGIVPGLGYFYSGNGRTGMTALSVIAIFGSLAYFGSYNESYYIAATTGTIAALFYGGSIVGGYLESKRYNKKLQKRILNETEYLEKYADERKYLHDNYGAGSID